MAFWQDARRLPMSWHAARLLIAGSGHQAFLDRRWIPWLLGVTPPRYRRGLALRILSLSPHYFSERGGYPSEWSLRRALEAEFDRNRRTRQEIAEHLLAPIVRPQATVLDFGCGPGFLAQAMSKRVKDVIALDVSAGTLACAHQLNPGPSYRLSRGTPLPVDDSSVDILYSIAVFQHIYPAQWRSYFDAFARVLRPGGQGLCHFAIADGKPRVWNPRGLRGLYSLRFQESTSETVVGMLTDAGFVDVEVRAVRDIAAIDDDVGRQHVASFFKPAGPAPVR